MEEREWKLGKDLLPSDSILDGLDFSDLILTVHCNCKELTEDAVWNELTEILRGRMDDLIYLVENNMEEILTAAAEGRE